VVDIASFNGTLNQQPASGDGVDVAMKFNGVSERPSEYTHDFDYEYEHRDAEHEHEEEPEQSDADEGLDRPFLTCVESTARAR
jgi:hypothetical protein